jgi:hypothetical protein
VTIVTLLAGGCDVTVMVHSGEAQLKVVQVLARDNVKNVMTKLFNNTSPLKTFK